MEKYIKYLPLTLFSIAGIKAISIGGSAIDVAVLFVLGLASAFYEFKAQNRAMEVVHKRCEEIDKHLSILYKKDLEVRGLIQTIQLPSQLRMASGNK